MRPTRIRSTRWLALALGGVVASLVGARPLAAQVPPSQPAEPVNPKPSVPPPVVQPAKPEPGKNQPDPSKHDPKAAVPPADSPQAPLSEAEQQKEAAKDPKVARDVSQFNLGDEGLAIGGFDPVAYFPEGGGKPARGKDSLAYRYRGVVYRFKDDANKQRFVADPGKYEPLFGGWCAYGCAQEDKVEVDPESFLIEDGHLMLFYDGFLADTRAKWLDQGSKQLKPKADSYWAKIVLPKRG